MKIRKGQKVRLAPMTAAVVGVDRMATLGTVIAVWEGKAEVAWESTPRPLPEVWDVKRLRVVAAAS